MKKETAKSLVYWGFRHREQIVLGVMETLVYPLRELVQKQAMGLQPWYSEKER